MNFTSYAPNFEDVLLWRALGALEQGFYIDVGAADPVHGSVTQAFYQRGWRGLNFEPAPGLYARLNAARPADINLAQGAGALADAEAQVFYEAPAGQGSGFLPAQAQACRAKGETVVQRAAALTTLSAACREHGVQTIHFLNVAVNGDEAAVLAGMDWQQWRPWIVLVQDGPARAAMEETMAAARYLPAHFDGQKHFYVAEEQQVLRAALALPPHAADHFTLYEGHHYAHPLTEWQQRTASAEQAAKAANDWATSHERGWTERATHAVTQLVQAKRDKEHTETTLNRLLQEALSRAAHAEGVAAHEGANGRRVEAELAGIYGSTAWKLSRPIRGMVKVARFGRDKLRHWSWRLRHGLAQFRARARAAVLARVKAVVKGALHFVTSRPALAFFLRRQIGRFPRMVSLLRAVAMRAKAQPVAADPSGLVASELQHLPAAARQVYDELQRAMQQSRNQSSGS